VAYECGDPLIGDKTDVELAAEWPGEPGKLCQALLDCRFLDENDGGFSVHDLYDHAPEYVQRRMEREEKRRIKGQTISQLRSEAGKKGGRPPKANDRLLLSAEKQTAQLPHPHPHPHPAAAGAAAANGEEKAKQAVQIFSRLGIPAETIWPHVDKDPALALEVAQHCQERFEDCNGSLIRNRNAYALGALNDPGKYGFIKTADVWRRPKTDARPKETAKDRAQKDVALIRQRQEQEKRDQELRAQPVEKLNRG
jgi:hypothetical protein